MNSYFFFFFYYFPPAYLNKFRTLQNEYEFYLFFVGKMYVQIIIYE